MGKPGAGAGPMGRPLGAEPASRAAIFGAVAMIAHQVGGKATRDTLFLSTFQVSKLPWVMVGSALLTIVATVAFARAMRRFGPGRVVPVAYLASAALHLGEWGMLAPRTRAWAAVALYLHMAAVPVLISAFWSILSEGIDSRANRRQMARAALAASLGGVLGGAMVWFRGVALSLPLLAVLHVACAAATRGLRPGELDGPERDAPAIQDRAPGDRPGSDALRRAPYLGYLAIGVMLCAASAALLEFVFKAQAQAAAPAPTDMRHVFSIFYAATALLALVVQLALGRWALRHVGLAPTAAALPLSVVVGSGLALAFPGLLTSAVARGSEVVVRNSLFRSAYEPLYTAVPAKLKNASKTIVDVGFERVGDALGAGVALVLLPLGALPAMRAQLVVALALAAAAVALTRLIHVGYKEVLRRNIVDGAVSIDPGAMTDSVSIKIARDTLGARWNPGTAPAVTGLDRQIAALESDDPAAIQSALASAPALPPPLVPYVISLLGRDEVAAPAIASLRAVVSAHVGQLVDRLLDRGVPLPVRRRIPRVLDASDSPRAVTGLLDGLRDPHFEIRIQCGRALVRMRDRNPDLPIDDAPVRSIVLREVAVGRDVWEAHQMLEIPEDRGAGSPVEEQVRRRANRGLEHVFNLLSLLLQRQPVRLAFWALSTDDRSLRGTALDYLETVLPAPIRDRLWPFLEAERSRRAEPRSREAALEALLRSHQSIEISLTELHRRMGSPEAPAS